jgi:hypothetical protein
MNGLRKSKYGEAKEYLQTQIKRRWGREEVVSGTKVDLDRADGRS